MRNNSFTSASVVERFLQLGRPGRRGFGGAADPAEAAALREVTRGDHDLNPGMTLPSSALCPAAVLVPLIDRPEGMSVLLVESEEEAILCPRHQLVRLDGQPVSCAPMLATAAW